MPMDLDAASSNAMPKAYSSREVERKWMDYWLSRRTFHADASSPKKPFTIVIPPPNITGILHMGHALNNTLQDILIRTRRMQGFEALWIPGTDHAGIATQNVIERHLRKEGIQPKEIGREAFLQHVWKWRAKYGGTILEQLKRLGYSCDWERARFTMDEGLSRAVRTVFVHLYKKGLIYKDHYIINWCPRCQTALSDEEVTHKEIAGHFYHIRYTVQDSDETLVIATTRPETLLGDTAVGAHPDDARYSFLKGKTVLLPLLKRPLKVVFDKAIDPQFGTGALKITPAHDPADFVLGKKHQLPSLNILNTDGTLNEAAGPYKGLDRFEARKRVVSDLDTQGLLVKVEDHPHSVGHCYRCQTIVEPFCSDQWFVRMKPLAEPAIRAVQKGEIRFHPARWSKVYLEWMLNIRDWCISRQIWWGHRIPAWTCLECRERHPKTSREWIVAVETPKTCPRCQSVNLEQETDVLDTWFSSWLWPFSTMGWPDSTADLKKFYPTQALVTGYEIIFFWVARMIMAGFEFMKKKPFKDIYIHGIVRDAEGLKMSKSLGNVVDPLDLIDEFGADALRYSIVSITSEGQDVYASKERFEVGRNFANKIWNAVRFALPHLASPGAKRPPSSSFAPADEWILGRLDQLTQGVTRALDQYRFNEATSLLYHFFWNAFCDWYLEFIKLEPGRPSTRWTLRETLTTSLRLLHPVMPYLTEELWTQIHPDQPGTLSVASWPKVPRRSLVSSKTVGAKAIESEMEKVIHLIQSVRNVRAEWKISPKEELTVVIKAQNTKLASRFVRYAPYVKRLVRASTIEAAVKIRRPSQSVVACVGPLEAYVCLSGTVDIGREQERMKSDLRDLDRLITDLGRRLSNEKFISRAPGAVIQKERQRMNELDDKKKRLLDHLNALAD